MKSGVRKRTAPPPRKASPPRGDGAPEVEDTFKQKLAEIKRMRSSALSSSAGSSSGPATKASGSTELLQRASNETPIIPKQVMTLSGVKTFLKAFGPWVEVVSKSGKVYYYNKKSQANQWKKPDEWAEEEKRLNSIAAPPQPPPETDQPPLPPEPPVAPPPSTAPNVQPVKPKVKLKLKAKKKVLAKKKKAELKLPLAYQKNPVNKLLETSDEETEDSKEKLTIENAFEDPESGGDDDKAKLVKLDKQDEIGHIKLPESDDPAAVKPVSTDNKAVADSKTEPPLPPPPSGTVLSAGPDRANNLRKGSAAELAFQNISKVSEAKAIYGNGAENLSSTVTGNPTFFTEYNLPCCIKRCKFPKEQVLFNNGS